MIEMYNRLKDRGFEILALSIDQEKHAVKPFLEKNPLPFPVLFAEQAKELYDANTIPANYFIDRRGNIRWKKIGFGSGLEEQFSIAIEELLAAPATPVP